MFQMADGYLDSAKFYLLQLFVTYVCFIFPGSTGALNQIRTSDSGGQQRSEVDSILASSSSTVPPVDPQPVESSVSVKV